MTPRLALFLLLGLDAAILLSEASSLSLTYHGAKLLYAYEPSSMTRIIQTSIALFGQNDIALRLPMIIMNLLSALLLYAIAGRYAKHERERVWLVGIFLLLPGIISASLLVDNAALITLGLFAYLFLQQRYGRGADLMLPLLAWVDAAFMLLFLGLALHAYKERAYRTAGIYAALFAVTLWWYGFNTGGLPQNQFLDTFGLYAAVFSPIVFIYMVYVLYRRFISKRTDVIWTVATTALLLSLVLSFRQRIEIEAFAPFLMAALPLGMQTFYHSYRVRLRPFRKRYRLLFALAVATLVLNAAAVFFNKAAYLFLENPSGFFAYRAHVAKELAAALKQEGVACATFQDDTMQLRIRFYGIERCEDTYVGQKEVKKASSVTIRYYNVPIAEYYVTKIPKK
jgi:4-amino-4-deoxy-L-arabinose transferase-like glycosyltransferase